MKTRRKKYFKDITIILMATMMLSLFGCIDTTEDVLGTVTDDNFLLTDDQVAAVLGNTYTSLYAGYMQAYGYFGIQEVTSDEMVVPQRGQDWFAGGTWIRMKQHTYTADESMLNDTWVFLYRGVNTCNRIIFQLEQAGSTGLEEAIAEIRALRALYYYFLIDTFGNVPIVDRFDVSQDFAPANNSRQEVYNFIEKEILESLPLLTREVSQNTYSRMTYYAAQALLAKLYLNAEVYTGTPQWQKASDAASEIIDSGRFNLMSNYFENFSVNNSNLPESILAIPYDEVFAQGNTLAVISLHYASQQTFNLRQQPWNGFSTTAEFYEKYSENDVRINSFLVGPQYTSTGEPLLDPGAESNDPFGQHVVFTPEINELYPQALRQAGARIAKYEIALGSNPANMNNDVHIFRYADILLVKAEALWRMNPNNIEALMLVNMIRQRAGVEPFNSLSADKLLDERGRELFVELVRRQDMIRFGAYFEPILFKDQISPAHVKIFPIPTPQLNSNPNLVQNPGY